MADRGDNALKTKLAALELIAGLCGWASILGGIGSVAFAVNKFAFAGGWPPLLICLGAWLIGGWLCRGFRDNQIRVAFEAELIKQGMTKEQAAASWTRESMRRRQ